MVRQRPARKPSAVCFTFASELPSHGNTSRGTTNGSRSLWWRYQKGRHRARYTRHSSPSSLKCRRSSTAAVLTLLLVLPVTALAQGSPFDTGFTAIQSLFTGTIAKVASLVAIVIGGYGFAHGEPGAKKALAGVAAGTGIAVLAVNVLSWLWGV
ncbi:MAG: TrbC/VirB2 family protein [Candidatus Sulfotelmatobacter sp.]